MGNRLACGLGFRVGFKSWKIDMVNAVKDGRGESEAVEALSSESSVEAEATIGVGGATGAGDPNNAEFLRDRPVGEIGARLMSEGK